jgi:hypothetical protein
MDLRRAVLHMLGVDGCDSPHLMTDVLTHLRRGYASVELRALVGMQAYFVVDGVGVHLWEEGPRDDVAVMIYASLGRHGAVRANVVKYVDGAPLMVYEDGMLIDHLAPLRKDWTRNWKLNWDEFKNLHFPTAEVRTGRMYYLSALDIVALVEAALASAGFD